MGKEMLTILGVAFFLAMIGGVSASEGLVSHWNFDEGSGNVLGDLEGYNDGDIYGATWTEGVCGNALDFDGVDDYVRVPDSESLNIPDAITVMMWLRPDYFSEGWPTFISHGQGTSGGWWNHINSDGSIRWRMFTSDGLFWGDRITFGFVAGEWTHLTWTYDGETLRFYKNSVLTSTNPFTGTITPPNAPLTFGWIEPYYYDGAIDEAVIYNYSLSAEEIKARYEAGRNCFAIPATIDIDPDTLNLNSKGKWVTAYIDLPAGYDINDINVSTVMLEGTIPAERSDIQDGTLMVKFDRSDVIDLVKALNLDLPADVELTVTGALTGGTLFEGSDTIRAIERGMCMMGRR